jgi:hypothetical protein
MCSMRTRSEDPLAALSDFDEGPLPTTATGVMFQRVA